MKAVIAIGAKETKRERPRRRKFRPLERDRQVVRWVYEAEATTREQVQRLLFSSGGRSRCQERLSLLVQNRYLDRLEGRQPNQPDVYVVGRRSINGLRLLRANGLEARPRALSPGRLQHVLEVNACRIQISAACSGGPLALASWLDEDGLREVMAREPILPDAYFQVVRVTSDGERRSAFFLEVERSDKADRAVREKFLAYGRLYYGGRYDQLFGTRSLRVLVLVGDSYGIRPERRIEKFAEMAARLDVTFLRFAPLAAFLGTAAAQAFSAPIWRRPGSAEGEALFDMSPTSAQGVAGSQ